MRARNRLRLLALTSSLVALVALVVCPAHAGEPPPDGGAAPPRASGPRLVLVNLSGQALRVLRFARDGETEFSDNLIDGGLGAALRREVASPADGSRGCTFDVQVVDSKGKEWVLQDALLCGAAALELLRDKGQLSFMVATEVPPEAPAKAAASTKTGPAPAPADRPSPPASATAKGIPEALVLANHAGLQFVELSLTSEGKEAVTTRMDLPEGGVRDEGELRLLPPTGRGCRYTLGLVDTGEREWTVKGVDLCGIARVELTRVGGGLVARRVPGR